MKNYESVNEYLQDQNIEFFLESGGQELRTLCPYCENLKKKLYINATSGLFHCFQCGESGKFSSLKINAPGLATAGKPN